MRFIRRQVLRFEKLLFRNQVNTNVFLVVSVKQMLLSIGTVLSCFFFNLSLLWCLCI